MLVMCLMTLVLICWLVLQYIVIDPETVLCSTDITGIRCYC